MSKVVCITGGAQGIGRAIAIAYAEAGYRVSIADLHKDAGFEVVKMIRSIGGEALYVRTDVANEKDIERWIEVTIADFGVIDVLVNNAGIGRNGPMIELSLSDFDHVLAVNLRSAFYCSQLAARNMKNRRSGTIIHIASTRALMSEPDTEAYAASKGGLLALTHAMAVSLGPDGIRVNAISPGWIETSYWQYSADVREPYHSERDKLQHPVGRVGTPIDIAKACLYLSSEDSGFMTGQNLVIDGGMTVKMIYE